MTLRIVPYTENEAGAVRAFNDRMRAAHAATDFVLPDQPNAPPRIGFEPPVAWTKYVVVDEASEVRGGFLLMKQPAWLNGEHAQALNYQAPLSEGIHDSRFGMVGLHMLRHLQRAGPYAFVVGMGHADRPLPRLLAAAGWTVRAVPFLFQMVRPGRVLRELPLLRRRSHLRVAARLAAASGAGWLAANALQYKAMGARRRARRLPLTRVEEWGSWADDLWRQTRDRMAFTVARDRATLECLYPLRDRRLIAYAIRDAGETIGWAVCLNTPMQAHSHFGNLRVATVLDAAGSPEIAPLLVARISGALAADGADLVVTNQSHAQWIDAFRRAGFLTGPSNYLLAMSKTLSAAIGRDIDKVHVTRGDGDGRIHL
jgi:hypothetical protein